MRTSHTLLLFHQETCDILLNSLLSSRLAGQLPGGYNDPVAAIKHGPAVSPSQECPEHTSKSDSVNGTPLFSGKTSDHSWCSVPAPHPDALRKELSIPGKLK